ncbi:unnamed protein product, partial [marine sediment metagenome]
MESTARGENAARGFPAMPRPSSPLANLRRSQMRR